MKKLLVVLVGVMSLALPACHGDSDGDGNPNPYLTNISTVLQRQCEGELAIHHTDGGIKYGWATYEEVRDGTLHNSLWNDVHGAMKATQAEEDFFHFKKDTYFFFSDGRPASNDTCAYPPN